MHLVCQNADGDRYEESRKDQCPVHITGQGAYSRQLLPKDILTPTTPPAPTTPTPQSVIGQPLVLIATVSFLAGIAAALAALVMVLRMAH